MAEQKAENWAPQKAVRSAEKRVSRLADSRVHMTADSSVACWELHLVVTREETSADSLVAQTARLRAARKVDEKAQSWVELTAVHLAQSMVGRMAASTADWKVVC